MVYAHQYELWTEGWFLILENSFPDFSHLPKEWNVRTFTFSMATEDPNVTKGSLSEEKKLLLKTPWTPCWWVQDLSI